MPYNSKTQAPILVHKKTRELLRAFAKREGRTIQGMTEAMIEKYAADNLATLSKSAARDFKNNTGVIAFADPPIPGMHEEPIAGMVIPPVQPMPIEERQVNRSCPAGWSIPEGRDKCMVKKCRSCTG